MQVHLRETLFDATQHFLVPIDLEIGMQATLHQHSGTAKFDSLFYFVVNGIEVEDIALFGFRPFQRPVKGAKGTVFGAKVRVVNVAIDNVCNHTFRVQLAALRVGFHAQSDQVIGSEQLKRFLFG